MNYNGSMLELTECIGALQVMQRFADSVRVQALLQSERSLSYALLLHALEVRPASHPAQPNITTRTGFAT